MQQTPWQFNVQRYKNFHILVFENLMHSFPQMILPYCLLDSENTVCSLYGLIQNTFACIGIALENVSNFPVWEISQYVRLMYHFWFAADSMWIIDRFDYIFRSIKSVYLCYMSYGFQYRLSTLILKKIKLPLELVMCISSDTSIWRIFLVTPVTKCKVDFYPFLPL